MKKRATQFLFFALLLFGTSFADFFEYNLNGQKVAIVNALGRRTALEYDEVGRLVKVTYSDGKIVTYRYDYNDNRIEMQDEHGTTRFAYDDLDQLISV